MKQEGGGDETRTCKRKRKRTERHRKRFGDVHHCLALLVRRVRSAHADVKKRLARPRETEAAVRSRREERSDDATVQAARGERERCVAILRAAVRFKRRRSRGALRLRGAFYN